MYYLFKAMKVKMNLFHMIVLNSSEILSLKIIYAKII